MKKILFVILIALVILCSCSNEINYTPSTYRGQYYHKSGSETIEYFDNITHDLRQLIYTYSYGDNNVIDTSKAGIRFAYVANYETFVDTLTDMIDSGFYNIYTEFSVEVENKSSKEKATEVADYYFDKCGISHEKTIVLQLRQNQREFWFDKLSPNFFIGYFENDNYRVLKVANIVIEEVSFYENYYRTII